MANARVLVSDKLSDAGLAYLKAQAGVEVDYKPGLKEADLCEVIGGYDGLIIRSGTTVTPAVVAKADKLRVIGRAGIGIDNVDVPSASKRGIVVMNTPTGNAVTTAEHALTLLLSMARKIPQATASMKAGKWEKSKFQGREVAGKTLGILGLGNIGRIVADRAQGLKMNVIGYDPVLSADRAKALGIELVSTDALFERSDFITMHTPLTPETTGLVNEKAFAKMKPGVFIVNPARGGIIDEKALENALKEGKIGGAALDVFVEEPPPADHPLLKFDNFICTPHLGASTDEAQERVALEICEQVVDFLRNGVIQNAVNMPSLPRELADKISPYRELARRLGRLIAQLEPVDPREVRVTCTGEAAELGVRPLAYAALGGFLERYLEEPINAVRAPVEAEARGIHLVEVREAAKGYTTSIRVAVKGPNGEHNILGTLSANGEPRLAELDGYALDAVIEGTTLVIYNEDKPGVIGAVGTLLGTRQINVARMQVGLDAKNKQAVALWNVDNTVSADVLQAIRALDNIRTALVVSL